ncbi:MAG: 2-oxoacid:ferredoxin oxidoreductase subunit beta [Chloroflexi bacterium]|nr:2-oxoacid:ferredoxin oxidoreductase subunit beta [Chloroflexota bacterium]
MSGKNPEYDFKWCPGCGDFSVRRALEIAMAERVQKSGLAAESNVVIAGIGCSGNLVHVLEGPQPYGFHGVHGRTLPVALGVKMARPDLNVVVVAGDGDFLGIGLEHVAPQAARNLDVTAVVMDNGVYGLTKGQSSPTTAHDAITSSTPYGKMEDPLNPLELYMAFGVSFIASGFSGQPKELARLISMAMEHPGFSIVHVQSPCTTYNDTYDVLKGDKKKGIEPRAYQVPADHDPSNREAAYKIIRSPGVPLGVLYQNRRPAMHEQLLKLQAKAGQPKPLRDLVGQFRL